MPGGGILVGTDASCKGHKVVDQVHIWFRCDASPTIGMGHLQRCLALGLSLHHNHSVLCHYLVRPPVEKPDWDWIRNAISAPFLLHMLPSHLTLETEPLYLVHYLAEVSCDALILDLFEATETYLRSVQDAHVPVVVIDDFAALPTYPCDAIVNHHLQAKTLSYHTLPKTKLRLGPEFALLRPEFLEHRTARERDYPEFAAKLLISMGGADPHRVTYKVLMAIREMDEVVRKQLEVCVVLGPAYRQAEEIHAAAKSLARCLVVQSPKDLVSLMDAADIAITAGGGTVLELASLGVPSLIVAITQAQKTIAETYEEQGSAICLGLWSQVSTNKIASTLQSVVLRQDLRTQLGQQAMQLVDARGSDRIATFIQRELILAHGTHGGDGGSTSNSNWSS